MYPNEHDSFILSTEAAFADYAIARSIVFAARYFEFADEIEMGAWLLNDDDSLSPVEDFIPRAEICDDIIRLALCLSNAMEDAIEDASSFHAPSDALTAWQHALEGDQFAADGWWHRISKLIERATLRNDIEITLGAGPDSMILNVMRKHAAIEALTTGAPQ